MKSSMSPSPLAERQSVLVTRPVAVVGVTGVLARELFLAAGAVSVNEQNDTRGDNVHGCFPFCDTLDLARSTSLFHFLTMSLARSDTSFFE